MPVALRVAESRTWFRATATLMGTTAEVLVDGTAEQLATGFRRLRALEASWSRFLPGSELNSLHHRAGRWTSISADLLRALVWAQRMAGETGGLFDPSIRVSLENLGYDRTYLAGLDTDRIAGDATPAPGLAGLEIDRRNQRARLAPGLAIDLGGIGKGLAADIVAGELVSNGARSAFVSLGGDIHACGEPAEGGSWPVPLIHPTSGQQFAVHNLAVGGLVMSTTELRTWRRGTRTVHHIIDPRTGEPTETDVIAVAVVAASAARAEALAKAAIVVGSAVGATLLTTAGVDAWLLTDSAVVKVEGSL